MDYEENLIDNNMVLQYDVIVLELEETSVLNVWGQEQDKFYLLDDMFMNETNSNLLFHEIRNNIGNIYKNMDISQIYDIFEKKYYISNNLSQRLFEEEITNEVAFSKKRNYIWNLYNKLSQNKKIIYFVCDDTKSKKNACEILQHAGYNKYEDIITRERAYKVLDTIRKQGKSILIIGRTNYLNDDECGYIFFPETRFVISGEFNTNITTNNSIYRAAGNMVYVPDMLRSPGYSIMMKMIANRFFDNPYVMWNAGSDFNADPVYLGYYALGMHLI